jgi:hypothetical protein
MSTFPQSWTRPNRVSTLARMAFDTFGNRTQHQEEVMAHARRNTPPVADHGFGGDGTLSNTAAPEAHDFDETPEAEPGGYGERWQEEAEAALEAFDRDAP